MTDSTKPLLTGDEYMSHFRNQTWMTQGPEMLQAMMENMAAMTPETMWPSMPKIREACIVGAGPNLRKNVHLLPKLAAKGVSLFVTDRALPIVMEHCEPEDIYCVTNLESTAHVLWDVEKWWSGLPTEKMTLVAPTFMEVYIRKKAWKGPVKFINPIFAHSDLNRISKRVQWLTGCPAMTTGSNVGVMSFILATNLGAKRLIFVGLEHTEHVLTPDIEMETYAPALDWSAQRVLEGLRSGSISSLEEAQRLAREAKPSFLVWNWFIGQWEFRYLSKIVVEKHRFEVFNCSESGMLYAPWIQALTLQELLDRYESLSPTATGGKVYEVMNVNGKDEMVEVKEEQ